VRRLLTIAFLLLSSICWGQEKFLGKWDGGICHFDPTATPMNTWVAPLRVEFYMDKDNQFQARLFDLQNRTFGLVDGSFKPPDIVTGKFEGNYEIKFHNYGTKLHGRGSYKPDTYDTAIFFRAAEGDSLQDFVRKNPKFCDDNQ